MIFETDLEKEVKVVGDIKNNNVSIDTNNIDFLVTILSTNLYSRPIESFIRETVSNAWDSHVEAGVSDPVILELGENTEGSYYCRIQDFGVGLSEERFNTIYKNIGSSTKRSSNEQIGGFGIGRFSALAYSDVVHIISNHEGQKYTYMMYKDGNSISIDLLHTQSTEERNGVEVTLPIRNGDIQNFRNAVKSQLVYFENLYIVDDIKDLYSIAEEYNNFGIKKYNSFWVNTLYEDPEISLILGKVKYPLRIDNLSRSYSDKVADYPISIPFAIGELDVTPNREEILYSEKNIALIEERLEKALSEIQQIIEDQEEIHLTKFSEYLNAIESKSYITLLEKENLTGGKDVVKIKIPSSQRVIYLNGQSFDTKNFLAMFKIIDSQRLLKTDYMLGYNGTLMYRQFNRALNDIKYDFEKYYVGDLGNVKNITKRYIRSEIQTGSYFIKPPKDLVSLIMKYKESINHFLLKSYDKPKGLTFFDYKAFKVIVKYYLGNLVHLKKISDASVPSYWIKQVKDEDARKRLLNKNKGVDLTQSVYLYTFNPGSYVNSYVQVSDHYPLKDLHKKFRKLSVYSEKDCPILHRFNSLLKNRNLVNCVGIAPTKLKLLKEIKNFVKIEKIMTHENKLIVNIATAEYILRKIPHLKRLKTTSNLSDISVNLSNTVSDLWDFVEKYSTIDRNDELLLAIYDMCEKEGAFNQKIIAAYENKKEELENAKILIQFKPYVEGWSDIRGDQINLLVDYVLTKKLIRPSVQAVLKLRKETIFNKKEDENNEN